VDEEGIVELAFVLQLEGREMILLFCVEIRNIDCDDDQVRN
jgi:hypothetical protein